MGSAEDSGVPFGGPAGHAGATAIDPFDEDVHDPFNEDVHDPFDASANDYPAGGGTMHDAGGFDPTQFAALAADFDEDRRQLEDAGKQSEAVGHELLSSHVHEPTSQHHASTPPHPVSVRSRMPLRAPSRRGAIIAACAVGVLAVGGVGAMALSGGGDDAGSKPAAVTAAKPYEMRRATPPGWSSTAAWAHPASVGSSVAVRGNTIAYLATSGSMVILNEKGSQLASSPPTGLVKDAAVGIAQSDGSTFVVASQQDQTLVWDTKSLSPSGEAKKAKLPGNAVVTWNGGGALVTGGTDPGVLNADGSVRTVKALSGYTPIAATPEGDVVMARATSEWKIVGKDSKVRTVTPDKPQGLTGSMNPAWESNGVLVAWGATSDPKTRTMAFYDVGSGKIKAQTKVSTDVVNQGLKLTVNTEGTRASAGPVLANLENGTVTVVPGWENVSSDARTVYGQDGSVFKSWDGGDAKDGAMLTENSAIPWGSTSNGNAIAVDDDSAGHQSIISLPAIGHSS